MIIADPARPPTLQDARSIATALLGKSTEALLSNDFDSYAECFSFPTRLETFEGNRMVRTRSELNIIFGDIRSYLAVNNVSQLVRKFIEIECISDSEIHTLHESYALDGTTLVKQPVPVLSVLQRMGGNWKVTKSAYAIPAPDDFGKALIPVTQQSSASKDA